MMKTEIGFINQKLANDFDKLKNSKTEDKDLYKWLNSAFEVLTQDPQKGAKVRKQKVLKKYNKKYGVDNLRKYDLPEGWRLFYTLEHKKLVAVAIILKWGTHKDYERELDLNPNSGQERFNKMMKMALRTSFIKHQIADTGYGLTYLLGEPAQVTIDQTTFEIIIRDIDDEWVLPIKRVGNVSGHPKVLFVETGEGDFIITEIRGRVVVDPHYTTIPPGNYTLE